MKKCLLAIVITCTLPATLFAAYGQFGDEDSGESRLRVTEEWYRAIWGASIGFRGLMVADLEGRGEFKILASADPGVAGENQFWYVISYDGRQYVREWISSPYDRYVRSLQLSDLNHDGRPEILVGLEEMEYHQGSQILVYDSISYEKLATFPIEARSVSGLEVADVDADGVLEFVFCDQDGLYVYDAARGTLEYSLPEVDFLFFDIAVGNVDRDSALEIITRTQVIDGETREVEWTYHSGFGDFIEASDVDGDGIAEIVGTEQYEPVTIYDADLRSPTWEITYQDSLRTMTLADVNRDNRPDILFGRVGGEIEAWDGQTRQRIFLMNNEEQLGVTGIAVGDTDGDGETEIVWGSGWYSFFGDYLNVADIATEQVEWHSDDIRGPFYALDHGDVDADGEPELLYGSYKSQDEYRDGLFFVHDAYTKALEYKSGNPTGSDAVGLWRIRHANVDDDPQAEIFITTSVDYDGALICYDGLTHEEQWRWVSNDLYSSGFHALEVVDIDADGTLELVALRGLHIEIHDAASGKQEWKSRDLWDSYQDGIFLRVADVDGDGRLEILAAANTLYVFDGILRQEEMRTEELRIEALDTYDLDGDGVEDIVIGTYDGLIQRLDPVTGRVAATLAALDVELQGLALVDVTGDSIADYVFSFGGFWPQPEEVAILDGLTSEWLWRSAPVGYGVGYNDSLLVADIDEDGRLEIVVNVGTVGFRVYQIDGLAEGNCNATATSMCLNANRFQVEIEWQDHRGQSGSGQVVPAPSDDSGLFWFFGANNWEVLVKVLNGCGVNDNFWVFAAATTDVQYTLRVTDTATGEEREYFNPLGVSSPAVADTAAFATCEADIAGKAAPVPKGDTGALVLNQRFRVDVTWRDFAGNTGQARAVPFGTADSGLLWFFAPDNWEMLIKVLDGCTVNDRFWVFSAATTNVEYTLRVTDTQTGQIKTYTNALGENADAVTDTAAFDGCP